jgi:Fe2+ transport system protein FeoA
MSEDPQTLADVGVGRRAVVGRMTCPRAIRIRLLEMGLVPGTEVIVTRRAPLGDPIELSVRGYKLSIRKAEARAISLQPDSRQADEAR